MSEEEVLANVQKLIDSGKLGEIPELKGSLYEVADKLINDKEKFATLLCLISPCVFGKYIRMFGDIATTSIKYKKEKKAYLPNILLDILKILEMIKYISIKEDEIIIEILDKELANDLNMLKERLLKEKPEMSLDDYYANLDKLKEATKDL